MQSESETLAELERQLSHPSGEKGLEVADMMHATNIGMTRSSIAFLNLRAEQQVLELGHGNAAHLPLVLEQAPDLQYTGLDISTAMRDEACRINAAFVEQGRAVFQAYEGSVIPFETGSFDRIFTVNTLYFWRNPESFLQELFRVLRPGGVLAVTWAQKSFMQSLPFIGERFRLYDNDDFTTLVAKTAFRIDKLQTETEHVRTKTGEFVERDFTVGLLQKS